MSSARRRTAPRAAAAPASARDQPTMFSLPASRTLAITLSWPARPGRPCLSERRQRSALDRHVLEEVLPRKSTILAGGDHALEIALEQPNALGPVPVHLGRFGLEDVVGLLVQVQTLGHVRLGRGLPHQLVELVVLVVPVVLTRGGQEDDAVPVVGIGVVGVPTV